MSEDAVLNVKKVVSLIVICQRSNLAEYREILSLCLGQHKRSEGKWSLCACVAACCNSSLSEGPADRLQLQMERRRAMCVVGVRVLSGRWTHLSPQHPASVAR